MPTLPSSTSTVLPEYLRLPDCPLPRPSERVCWFANARPVSGILVGHNIDGNALILNQFGTGVVKPFDEIRLQDPFERRRPNWFYLPPKAILIRPDSDLSSRFQFLLSQRI